MMNRVNVVAGALCILALGRPCVGSIYPVKAVIEPHNADSFIRDTPMYSLEESPSWIGGLSDPFVQITGTVKSTSKESLHSLSSSKAVLRFIHAWAEKAPNVEKLKDTENFFLCSSEPDRDDFDGYEMKTVEVDKDVDHLDFDVKFPVNSTSWHIVITTNCLDLSVELDANFIYKNPFGYLNGWAFGILPMNMFLSLFYFLLAFAYTFKVMRNRAHVLRLHYAVLGVIVMGFVERFTWFLTYWEMNSSGAKACCPVRADLTFSLAMAVFKRSSSAILVLMVCLGYGTVKPSLDRGTNLKILALGIFYTAASLNLELQKVSDISEHGRQTNPYFMLSLAVSICDVIILFWIYFAISAILADLREAQQIAKLSMYQSLARALALWVVVWCFSTIGEVMVQGNIDEAWRWWSILASFWDIFFLGILMQICYIFLPSEKSSQIAYSHQIPNTEDLDEFSSAGLEMQMPDTPSDFVIGGDDDDDDSDISLDGIEAELEMTEQNGNGHTKVAID